MNCKGIEIMVNNVTLVRKKGGKNVSSGNYCRFHCDGFS